MSSTSYMTESLVASAFLHLMMNGSRWLYLDVTELAKYRDACNEYISGHRGSTPLRIYRDDLIGMLTDNAWVFDYESDPWNSVERILLRTDRFSRSELEGYLGSLVVTADAIQRKALSDDDVVKVLVNRGENQEYKVSIPVTLELVTDGFDSYDDAKGAIRDNLGLLTKAFEEGIRKSVTPDGYSYERPTVHLEGMSLS